MYNIFQHITNAWINCEFPGQDKYEFYVNWHAFGWGEHALVLSWLVPNTDPQESTHTWQDRFGNKHSWTAKHGEMISVCHSARFSFDDVYPTYQEGFFERLICQIHTELVVHEALETFTVNGHRKWYPHTKANVVCPRTGVLKMNESWRNIVAWAGVKTALDPNGPKLPLWAKQIVWVHKTRRELRQLNIIWTNFKTNVGSFDGWAIPRYVVSCLNDVISVVIERESIKMWRLENWLGDKRNEQLAKRHKKRTEEAEKLKEAA